MRLSRKLRKVGELIVHPHLFLTGQSKYLFILSHPRSRSSLLSHILGSHPEICGYRELRGSYRHAFDVVNMRRKLYRDLECDFRGKILLDKIVQNQHALPLLFSNGTTPPDRGLGIANRKILFLLREPKSTLRSILHMARMFEVAQCRTAEGAAELYCSRLARLEEYAGLLNGSYVFIESNELVNAPGTVLETLSTWLGLEPALSADYQQFKHTGVPGYGDPSDHIRSGTIQATQRHEDIEIAPELLEQAQAAYDTCRAVLSKSAAG